MPPRPAERSMVDITPEELRKVFAIKYGDLARCGWNPRIRYRFGYFSPDEHYEALVMRLVHQGCAWLDVGCGRHVFPSNAPLARLLADRAAVLVGLDPDPTLAQNRFVHERLPFSMEAFQPDREFDLVTMRMVAEHVAEPERFMASLARTLRSGGRAVVYTVYRYAPVPLLTSIVPFSLHHPAKRLLWKTDPKDTFPTEFRMNTRARLVDLFSRHGLTEEYFAYLDDCRTLARLRPGLLLELSLWKGLRAVGMPYPERCLLGVYQKQ
jgi:SAM-dependent methyltransferase